MNKKGFTVVELIVSITLTFVIVSLLFQVLLALRDVYVSSGVRTQLLNKQTLMSSKLNEDLYGKSLSSVLKCGRNCLNFIYSDGSSARLVVDTSNNIFRYGEYSTELVSGSRFSDVDIRVEKVSDMPTNKKDSLLILNIPVNHNLFDSNYGVNVIYPFDSFTTAIEDVVFDGHNEVESQVVLKGSANMRVVNYQEPGYYTVEGDSDLIENDPRVEVTSDVDNDTPGHYEVVYTFRIDGGVVDIKTRRVEIVESLGSANRPRLSDGLTPVVWNESTNSFDTTDPTDPNWYDYSNSRWANARSNDGSYWVWIPRYTYRVVSGFNTSTAGEVEVSFSFGIDDSLAGTLEINRDEGSAAADGTFTTHPAFTFGDKQITGFWVAKYDASALEGLANPIWAEDVDPDTDCAPDNVTTKTVQSIPNTNAWRCISPNNIFTVTKNMQNDAIYGFDSSKVDTHLLRNTQWGAIAFLSASEYGNNAQKVRINNSSHFITGCAATNPPFAADPDYDDFYPGCQNEFYTSTGVLASTTRNVTGVYDMAGNAFNLVAAFVDNNHEVLLNHDVLTNAESKYVDVYPVADPDNSYPNYDLAAETFRGEAIFETSVEGYNFTSWHNERSYYPRTSFPLFLRGDGFERGNSTGIFTFNRSPGNPNINIGFRPALIVLD